MTQDNQSMLLGTHISIAKGFDQAVILAHQLGCTAIQFFSKSNRQWRARQITEQEILNLKHAISRSSIQRIIIHASYLINLGSPNKTVSQKSTKALQDELRRAEQLSANYLVFHPGSRKNKCETLCLDLIAQNINHILSHTHTHTTKLLLETMAGQGSSVGHTFEQLAYIYQAIERKDRVGICLDTCHIFAAGYDISTQDNYEQTLRSFDEIIGLKKLCVIHINDSKKTLGSRIDRHEHIGKGTIGLEGFRLIINDKRLAHIPKILETPKDSLEDDIQNMQKIKKLIITD